MKINLWFFLFIITLAVCMFLPRKKTVIIHDIDSLYIVNESIVERVKYIKQIYEKEVPIIMSNTDSSNLKFFVKYIKNYNMKLE